MRRLKGATVKEMAQLVQRLSVCPIYRPQYTDPPFRSGNQVRLFMSPVRRDFRGTCSALSSPSSNDASKYHIDPEPQPHPLCPHHAPIFEMKGDKKKQVTPPHRLLSLLLIPLFLHQENRNQGGRLGGERDASIAIQSHSTLHVNPLCTEMDSYKNDGI